MNEEQFKLLLADFVIQVRKLELENTALKKALMEKQPGTPGDSVQPTRSEAT